MPSDVSDLHDKRSTRAGLLSVNNASARETSLLTPEKFDRMISAASVATFVEPDAAFLLAFAQHDDYDGRHFLWFRARYDRFLYIDRVVVTERHRRSGLGRRLYADLFRRADQLGHANITCEVNTQPPNPTSDAFHANQGFDEVGSATVDDGSKTVRYLLRHRPAP